MSDAVAILHWLRLPERVNFKLSLMAYRVLNGIWRRYHRPIWINSFRYQSCQVGERRLIYVVHAAAAHPAVPSAVSVNSWPSLIPYRSLHFYPRDAMLARVFARATCSSVRLSVWLFREFLGISQISDATTAKRMKIDQYCQRQRCKHVELEQFLYIHLYSS